MLGNQLGDHVGDWEHNLVRFENGVPTAVWYSQHANGEAFAWKTVLKDVAGKRPLVYAANGSHALYPTPVSRPTLEQSSHVFIHARDARRDCHITH